MDAAGNILFVCFVLFVFLFVFFFVLPFLGYSTMAVNDSDPAPCGACGFEVYLLKAHFIFRSPLYK